MATEKVRPVRSGLKLAVAALAVVAFFPLAAAMSGFLSTLSNPFSTTRHDTVQPAVLQSLQDLADYHAASANLQQVVEVSHDADHVPGFLVGDDAKLLAVGKVDAVVDFSGVTATSVQPSQDGTSVTVTLPAPHYGSTQLDMGSTQVLSHDRGLMNRVGGLFTDDPTPDQGLYQLGEQALADAATSTDLIDRAEANTRVMLAGLFEGAGIKSVQVTFVEPPAP
jgi:hypothetical protein